jgi:cell division protein ZapD
LLGWLKPLNPLRDGLTIVLRLLRASGHPEHKTASAGAFQLMQGGTGAAQMVRILLKLHDPYIPEISANRYALNIRFTRPESDNRPRQCDNDVTFDIVFCTL